MSAYQSLLKGSEKDMVSASSHLGGFGGSTLSDSGFGGSSFGGGGGNVGGRSSGVGSSVGGGPQSSANTAALYNALSRGRSLTPNPLGLPNIGGPPGSGGGLSSRMSHQPSPSNSQPPLPSAGSAALQPPGGAAGPPGGLGGLQSLFAPSSGGSGGPLPPLQLPSGSTTQQQQQSLQHSPNSSSSNTSAGFPSSGSGGFPSSGSGGGFPSSGSSGFPPSGSGGFPSSGSGAGGFLSSSQGGGFSSSGSGGGFPSSGSGGGHFVPGSSGGSGAGAGRFGLGGSVGSGGASLASSSALSALFNPNAGNKGLDVSSASSAFKNHGGGSANALALNKMLSAGGGCVVNDSSVFGGGGGGSAGMGGFGTSGPLGLSEMDFPSLTTAPQLHHFGGPPCSLPGTAGSGGGSTFGGYGVSNNIGSGGGAMPPNSTFGGSAGGLSMSGMSSGQFDVSSMSSIMGGNSSGLNGSGRAGFQGTGSSSNFAGLMKTGSDSQSNEFQINSEDFPALQGTNQSMENSRTNGTVVTNNTEANDVRYPGDKSLLSNKQQGIQINSSGVITNIPCGMIRDQFGIVGMLALLRSIESHPALVNLAVGHDLTTLGLNLNAPEGLFRTFAGPWMDHPCRPQDIDHPVPIEYLTNAAIREKLPGIKLNRHGEDLLFFLFYTCCGEFFQLAAAAELYNRDWRYFKDERVWVTRAPGIVPVEKTNTYERGTYYVFDPAQWRKVTKELILEYDRLEDRPVLPQPQLQQQQQLSQLQQQQQQQQQQSSSSSAAAAMAMQHQTAAGTPQSATAAGGGGGPPIFPPPPLQQPPQQGSSAGASSVHHQFLYQHGGAGGPVGGSDGGLGSGTMPLPGSLQSLALGQVAPPGSSGPASLQANSMLS